MGQISELSMVLNTNICTCSILKNETMLVVDFARGQRRCVCFYVDLTMPHVSCISCTSLSCFQERVTKFADVAYIDVVNESTKGYIRCADGTSAARLSDAHVAHHNFSLVTGISQHRPCWSPSFVISYYST